MHCIIYCILYLYKKSCRVEVFNGYNISKTIISYIINLDIYTYNKYEKELKVYTFPNRKQEHYPSNIEFSMFIKKSNQ